MLGDGTCIVLMLSEAAQVPASEACRHEALQDGHRAFAGT